MHVSEKTLKWAMCFYPPLFFQGIWTRKFLKGFRGVEVCISPRLWNKNYNRSVFGGTLFSAADPFYAVLFDRILREKGYNCRIWLKGASIEFIRPVRGKVFFKIMISEREIQSIENRLISGEKYIGKFPITMQDASGQPYVEIQQHIYIRLHKNTL